MKGCSGIRRGEKVGRQRHGVAELCIIQASHPVTGPWKPGALSWQAFLRPHGFPALYDLAPDFPIGVDERTGDLLEAYEYLSLASLEANLEKEVVGPAEEKLEALKAKP